MSIAHFKSLIILLITAYFMHNAISLEWCFFDWANLFIHEVGHLIFMPFGQFIYVAGGSFFQSLVPLLLMIYFFRQRDYFAGSFVMIWLGQTLINTSTYIKDAEFLRLHLLGGGLHDWNYLLSELGVLQMAGSIGSSVHIIGMIIIIIGGCLGVYYSMHSQEIERLKDKL